jgi:hypothetical protein
MRAENQRLEGGSMKQSAKVAAVALAFGVVGAAQAQYKCVGPGGVSYQQAPCPATAKAQALDLRVIPAPVAASRASAPSAGPAGPADLPAAVPAAAGPVAAPDRSRVELLAEQCLEWYRPRLRDPRGAYLRKQEIEKNIVSMDIHATNGFGGYVVKRARCEFKGTGIDEDWTVIHAGRLGW